jgi:3-phosphoshikimate 1-carboxyvinyltransferase
MTKLNFKGNIPASKSVLNRALIVQSYFPELKLSGDSRCDDVLHMKKSLHLLSPYQSMVLDAGEGGTTFRFLAMRASRTSGAHQVQAHARLLRRPQKEIINILSHFGVRGEMTSAGIHLFSKGWVRPEKEFAVDCSRSSQYASALLLNAWSLPFELIFSLSKEKVSEAYMGMNIDRNGDQIRIPANQKINVSEYSVEPDMSSLFTIAAAGALSGQAEILNFPPKTAQPDQVFIQIFERMQISFSKTPASLKVQETSSYQGLQCNLHQSPDLFPVLAVLCAFAKGESKLFGAPQLAHKESNRIEQISKLFKQLGIQHESLPDGMIIQGGGLPKSTAALSFDPDQDHRMVMAATLLNLKWQNPNFKILHPEVVNKSLPEFFEMLGVRP